MTTIGQEQRQRILFGQSYFLRFDPKLWAAMQPYPPLGTLYAASYLRGRGYDVDLFDAMLAESESEWDAALARSQPRIAVLYEDNFNYLSKMCLLRMRQAAFAMIEMARQRGCTVIVAGSDATDHAEAYFNAGADYVLIGEGEETLGELVDHLLRDGPPLDAILGLAFERDGQLVITPRRPDLKDLDALPFPAWDLVDIERYRAMWYARHGYYSMNLATSRGCPYHCNWCAKPIWGQRYHVRSPENVVAELAWLKRTYKPDHVWFVDDIFRPHPRLGGALRRPGRGTRRRLVPFKSLQRVDLILKGDTIDACAGPAPSASGSAPSRARRRSSTPWKRAPRSSTSTRPRGACTQPASRSASSCSSATRARRARTSNARCRWCATAADDIGMSVSYPLPGTRFFTAVQHELGSKQNWEDSDDLAMLYRGPSTRPFTAGCTTCCTASSARSARGTSCGQPCATRRAAATPAALVRSVAYSKLVLPLLRLELGGELARHTGH